MLVEDAEEGVRWQTHWVPSTTFFFEAEGTLKEFVLQRRRWLNGTSAGYLWLLSEPALWRGVAGCGGTAWAVLLLSCMQVFVFGVVFVMPGLLLVTGYLAFSGVGLLLAFAGAGGAFLPSALAYSFLLAAVTTLVAHVYLARAGASNFTPWIWSLRVALNAVTMGVTLVTTVAVLAIAALAPAALQAQLQGGGRSASEALSDVQDARVAGCLGIVYTTVPFFLALLHSSESFAMMCKT